MLQLDYYGATATIIYHTYHEVAVKTLMIDLGIEREVLSTRDAFKRTRLVLNHYNPPSLWEHVHANWRTFEDEICSDLRMQRTKVAMLCTGVDMDTLAIHSESYQEFKVTVVATAGVAQNALRVGHDLGMSVERNGEFEHLGTINLIIMVNAKLSQNAMARSIITATEAKAAVLQDLNIKSSFSPDVLATGTGTDNLIIVSGSGVQISYTGGHSKIGELIGRATYCAIHQALANNSDEEPRQ